MQEPFQLHWYQFFTTIGLLVDNALLLSAPTTYYGSTDTVIILS